MKHDYFTVIDSHHQLRRTREPRELSISFVTVSQPQGGDGVCRGATSSSLSFRCLCFVYRYDPSTSITALAFPSTTTARILQKGMPVHDDHKRRRAQCLRETTNLTLQSVKVSCRTLLQRSLYTVTTTLEQVPCEPRTALLTQCQDYMLEWAQPHVMWPFNRCTHPLGNWMHDYVDWRGHHSHNGTEGGCGPPYFRRI